MVKLFFKVVVPFFNSTSSAWSSNFSTFSLTFVFFSFCFSHPIWNEVVSRHGFDLHFLND